MATLARSIARAGYKITKILLLKRIIYNKYINITNFLRLDFFGMKLGVKNIFRFFFNKNMCGDILVPI